MVTVEDVRRFASRLPRTTEVLVRDRVKFRVGSLVYVAFSRDETVMGFGFPKEERAALVASEPEKFMMPRASDLRYNWVLVRLAAIGRAEMRELVYDAWTMVVPKRVAATYDALHPRRRPASVRGRGRVEGGEALLRLPDITAPNLRILFVGINPGLYSAAAGHHFARPGNRFWRILHLAGVTAELVPPERDRSLLEIGVGLTNIVDRPSGMARELSLDELRAGARKVTGKIARLRPEAAVFFGAGAFRKAFARPKAALGLQPETIGATRIWLLPNPSGAQGAYQPEAVAGMLRQVVRSLEPSPPSPPG